MKRPPWQRIASALSGTAGVIVAGVLLFSGKITLTDALMIMAASGAAAVLPSAVPNGVK